MEENVYFFFLEMYSKICKNERICFKYLTNKKEEIKKGNVAKF